MILNYFHVQTRNFRGMKKKKKKCHKITKQPCAKTIQKTFATIKYINTLANTLATYHSNLLQKIPVILSIAKLKKIITGSETGGNVDFNNHKCQGKSVCS